MTKKNEGSTKYQVVIPWHGVKIDQILEIEGEVHRSIKPNVRRVGEVEEDEAEGDGKLTPATPGAGKGGKK